MRSWPLRRRPWPRSGPGSARTSFDEFYTERIGRRHQHLTPLVEEPDLAVVRRAAL